MSNPTPSAPSAELSPVKQALLEIRELRRRLATQQAQAREPIAIVGVGCRLPGGVRSPRELWALLRDGKQPIVDVPADRWDIDTFYDANPDAPGKMYARQGAFLDGVADFDPYFFGIPPREAHGMDPQQRLLLEVAWETLEEAGMDAARLNGSNTGVFLGIGGFDYAMLGTRGSGLEQIDAYLGSGVAHSVAAGRLAYFFGFQGPCLSIDTACSSSLVAVHQACSSLRAGECRIALAGGANLILVPDLSISFCRSRMLSPTSRCHTFDASADGYVRGEGVVLVALKRLSDAIADGDRIHALIRGSAVNQDGRSTGLTVPNGPAQQAVIESALRAAELTPADVQYVEAHGTGTPLGDPIEVQTLAAALGRGREPSQPLLIGSIKTNLGHLEASAGISGLLKVVLGMQAGEIPAHLGFETPSPHIDWRNLPVAVTAEHRAWPPGRRIAGVSSFGFSGTNAHVIVEAAPADARAAAAMPPRPLNLFVLSAKSDTALRTLASRHVVALREEAQASVADICHTAAVGRMHLSHRAAIVSRTKEELIEGLDAFMRGQRSRTVMAGEARQAPEIAFLFTGQGAQYVGMGKDLYLGEALFRDVVDRCAQALEGVLERDLRTVMFEDTGGLLDRTDYTQPALYALEVGMARLWQSWGVQPTVVLGHSVGEYAAACIAGVYSIETGARLIAERGRRMRALPGEGSMLAVQGAAPEVERVVADIVRSEPQLSIAARNAPGSLVLSGARPAIERAESRVQACGLVGHRLVVSHAFHSAQMEPMLADYGHFAQALEYQAPQLRWISNLTGDSLDWPAWATRMGEYWRRHVRESVQFERGVRAAARHGAEVFIEVGPHPVLCGLGRATLKEQPGLVWSGSLQRGTGAWDRLLESLMQLYVRGARIDWQAFDRDRQHRIVTLPTYPFERQRYWIEASDARHASHDAPLERNPDALWNRVTAAGDRQAQNGPLDLDIDSLAAKWPLLEQLSLAYMSTALRSLGLYARAGERHSPHSLAAAGGIRSVYVKLMERWMRHLVAAGLLIPQGDEFVAREPLPTPALDPLREVVRTAFAKYPELVEYVELCGHELSAVISGRQSALETLFPDGSNHIADGLYQGSIVARYFNDIVRAVVQAAVTSVDRPAILEIGAGTGGTTSLLLPELPENRTRYVFTDVSKLFLGKARERFGHCAFLEYGLLDIETAPATQGYPEHTFDIVIAANVLHATGDLARTLRNARSLLASNGILVMLETTDHPIWLDITTGLIEGWQKFDDPRRSSHPLLDAAQWSALLAECGFVAVAAFPARGTRTEQLGQHVIVARAPQLAAGVKRTGVQAATPSRSNDVVGSAPVESAEELRARLAAASAPEREDLLVDLVCTEIGAVLGIDSAHRPHAEQRLMEFGVDSLMAVELRNRLARRLGLTRKLTATLIFDYPTPQAIARYLARDLLDLETVAAASTAAPLEPASRKIARAELEQMDDAEAEALLAERLQRL